MQQPGPGILQKSSALRQAEDFCGLGAWFSIQLQIAPGRLLIVLLIIKSTHHAQNILERSSKHVFGKRLYGRMQFVILFLAGSGNT